MSATVPLYAAVGPSKPTSGIDVGKPDSSSFPFDMTEDDMKALTEFIESLDEDTLNALNEIGQEIIKEADELGIDPFDYIQLQAQMQQEYEEKAAKEKPEKGKPATSAQQPTAEAQTAQEVFKSIAKVIPVIMQKAGSDINLSNDILPFKYRLDDLVYYCTRLADDKMLKYLADPSSKELIEVARNLNKALTSLNDQLQVVEFSLEGEDPYEILDISRSASPEDMVTAYDKLLKIIDPDTLELNLIKNGKTDEEIKKEVDLAQKRLERVNNAYDVLRSKEESIYLLNKILDAVSEAVDSKKMIELATKLLQLHEPEALKLKKEQEKVESEARKAQDAFIKKRPLVTRSFNMPMPKQKGSRKNYGDDRSSRGDYFSPGKKSEKKESFKPSKPSTPSSKKGGEAKPSSKKPDDKNEKGKKPGKSGGPKPAGKGTQPSKGKPGEGKDGEAKDGEKKPLTSDIEKAKSIIEDKFAEIRKKIKKNEAIKFKGIAQFFTSAEDIDTAQNYINFITDLAASFEMLSSSIKRSVKKFEKNNDELKLFKEEIEKIFKKFEDSKQYKKIAILFNKNFKKGQKIKVGTEDKVLDPAKEALLFEAPKVEEGQEEKPLAIELLRDAYKKAKDEIASKKESKKPALPPSPTPFIG